MTSDVGPPPDFEIGLALAGAISAGAYTAGVIDFLFEALQAWEEERERGAPQHRVQIRTLAGASAGAVTGALGLVAMARGLRPVTLSDAERKAAQGSPGADFSAIRCVLPSLHDTWVTRPRMVAVDGSGQKDLLGDDDIVPKDAKGKPLKSDPAAPVLVRSLLNASVLDEIEWAALNYPTFDATAQAAPFPYLSKTMHVFMTVTNLRGIPFDVAFGNATYGMQTHGDRLHYRITGIGKANWPEGAWLAADTKLDLDAETLPKPGETSIPEAWLSYGNSALASAAFPGGLAPRTIKTPFSQYEGRQYPLRTEIYKIKSRFPNTVDLKGDYEFLSVDGGVVNNSPFDFVEFALWSHDQPRKTGPDSDRAVIMVAPFPEPPEFLGAGKPPAEIVSVLRSLFPTLINQARFRTSELGPALDPKDRSRFLISPSRSLADGPAERYPIACGLLGGFGGFLDEGFRAHDYQLGRRNCQRFLASIFGLPLSSDTMKDTEPAAHIALDVRHDAYETTTPEYMIIPLVGDAAREIGLPPWPRMSGRDFRKVMERVAGRFDAIKKPLVDAQVGKQEIRAAAMLLLRISRRRIFNYIELTMLADLVKRDQIAGWKLPAEVVDLTDQGIPGRTIDDVRSILAHLVTAGATPVSDSRIVAATHLDALFVVSAVEALSRADHVFPFHIVRMGDQNMLQMHIPTGIRAVPWIGSWIERFVPQSYRYD